MSIDNSRRSIPADMPAWGLAGWPPWTCSSETAPRRPTARTRWRPKTPPLPATAKSVISLFMQGGPSQVDTYDPKPLLAKLHGQHPPDELRQRRFPERQIPRHRDSRLQADLQEVRAIRHRGLRPVPAHFAACADDLAVIRSCYHEGFTHSQAQFLINNGWPRIGRPSLGSWILYGLGTREPEPARFRRPAGRRRPLRSRGLRPGLSARRLPGHLLPPGPQSDSQSHAAQGHGARAAARPARHACAK